MAPFRISTRGRLQDWIAVENGYFEEEGLRRAQMELDLEPERHKHHFLREIPERFHSAIDVRRFGTGERIVFLPYTAEAYERSQNWMRERELFVTDAQTPAYEAVVHV